MARPCKDRGDGAMIAPKSWRASVKPRKQRAWTRQPGYHMRKSLLSAHLSPELRAKYKSRALPLRKGDRVKVMAGEHAGKFAKITKVLPKQFAVFLEGLERTKADGSKSPLKFRPSKLMITELELRDKRRLKRRG